MARCAFFIALALSGCAPSYAVAKHRTPPVWLFAADMVAFSAGCIVGLGEYNDRHDRDKTLMYGGFGVALASWLPYWVVSTQ